MCSYPAPTHLVSDICTDDSIIWANMDDILHNNVHHHHHDGQESVEHVNDAGEGVDDANMCVVMDEGARVRSQDQSSAVQCWLGAGNMETFLPNALSVLLVSISPSVSVPASH